MLMDFKVVGYHVAICVHVNFPRPPCDVALISSIEAVYFWPGIRFFKVQKRSLYFYAGPIEAFSEIPFTSQIL